MRTIRAALLLIRGLLWLAVLMVWSKIREVKKKMPNKKKEKAIKLNRPTGLNLKPSPSSQRPPFPEESPKSQKPADLSGRIISEKIGDGSPIEPEISPIEIEGAGAFLDLPFRGAHLLWPDVAPLSKAELDYMAEPLAKVLVATGWQDKLKKAPYVQLGWGIGIAALSRFRLHKRFIAAQKVAEVKAAPKAPAPGSPASSSPAPESSGKAERPESDMRKAAIAVDVERES